MKNTYFRWLTVTFLAFIFVGCASQIYLDKSTLDKIINEEAFTFMAQKAHPTNYDVINVINSLPNATSSRILELSYGYTITFKNKEMDVVLPYFGRSYSPSRDSDKNSLRFTSKNYSISKKDGKNGLVILTVKPHDISQIENIYLEISKNGSAFVSVNANDRQPISYSGYIMRNEELKK